MLTQDVSFSKTLNPTVSLFSSPFHKPVSLLYKTVKFKPLVTINTYTTFSLQNSLFTIKNDGPVRREVRSFAGRSKTKHDGPSPGRLEGNAEVRREAKRNARRKSKKLAESLFYRLKNPGRRNHADNFSEEELQMIGLGYDRMVRFMERDDPNLRHPDDWYKYGEFGPYSWRGVVVGDPIRGRFSDECVTLIGEVKDHEEWEKIEQFEMASDFSKRLQEMDKSVGLRYFWVFVRHPKWRLQELPWQQWTLVSEVVLEAGKQRLDKWNLMGRLGNKARSLITQCAAWMRPDIIYVKRPVYQCRFEPQDDFFNALIPFLDPKTENEFLFEVRDDEGRVEMCTYFGGLCKIVRVNPKAFVDEVVNAYQKLSEEKKSKCLEFLLTNHPEQLLHPYTREWKAKLEEMELGCDAPDEDEEEDVHRKNPGETRFIEWLEDDGNDDDEDEQDDVIVDMERGGDDELGAKEEDSGAEEDAEYWKEEFEKAISSGERMEKLAMRSVEASTKLYERQLRQTARIEEDGDETSMRGARAKVSPEEWKIVGIGPWRKRTKKSKIPPELFLRAAVRPFTYRNLVKEIVLTRHAILEGDIGRKTDEPC